MSLIVNTNISNFCRRRDFTLSLTFSAPSTTAFSVNVKRRLYTIDDIETSLIGGAFSMFQDLRRQANHL